MIIYLVMLHRCSAKHAEFGQGRPCVVHCALVRSLQAPEAYMGARCVPFRLLMEGVAHYGTLSCKGLRR